MRRSLCRNLSTASSGRPRKDNSGSPACPRSGGQRRIRGRAPDHAPRRLRPLGNYSVSDVLLGEAAASAGGRHDRCSQRHHRTQRNRSGIKDQVRQQLEELNATLEQRVQEEISRRRQEKIIFVFSSAVEDGGQEGRR